MMENENEELTRAPGPARPRPYTRETMRSGRRRPRGRSDGQKTPSTHVLGVQIVLCVLLLSGVFFLHLFGSSWDTAVRRDLAAALTGDFRSQASGLVRAVQTHLPDTKNIFSTPASSPSSSAANKKAASSQAAVKKNRASGSPSAETANASAQPA